MNEKLPAYQQYCESDPISCTRTNNAIKFKSNVSTRIEATCQNCNTRKGTCRSGKINRLSDILQVLQVTIKTTETFLGIVILTNCSTFFQLAQHLLLAQFKMHATIITCEDTRRGTLFDCNFQAQLDLGHAPFNRTRQLA